MKLSEFPLEKSNRLLPELREGAEQRLARYSYSDPPEMEVEAAPGYLSLLDYLRILVRHKAALLCFATAGLFVAIAISLMQTPVYRARTSLEIQDFNENFLDLQNVEPTNSSGNYATAQSNFETQVKILQSESVLERVIERLNHSEAQRASGRGALNHSDADKEALVHKAERNLTVRTIANSRLLEVLYESKDPKLAADFANTLVSEFTKQSQEMRWKSAQRTGEWLTSHLDEMKAKLEQSEAELQDYARVSGLTFTSEKDNVSEIRLKELQDELSKAEADRVSKEAKFEEARSKPAESLPEILDDPTLREYRLRLTELHRQLVELNETLTPAHYKVQRVQAQIAELQSTFQRQSALILRRIANEYATARRREEFLGQAYAEEQKSAADQSNKAIHYNTLKREVDSSRQLYQAMLQRVKQAELATTMRASNVLVVDPAKPPSFPYKPNMRINAALGLVTGLSLGIGFVLLRDRLDRRIHAPGDAQVYLKLPELGVLPVHEAATDRQIPNNSRLSGFRPILADTTAAASTDDCPELASWNRKPSLLAECARTALISVLLPDQAGGQPRVVVFTSPSAGDGKTTVASNLSIAMAEIGRKVLLIDGDLRRPRLHKILGVTNSWGLSDLIWADSPLETLPILHLVRETKVSGLSLLPAGSCSNVAPSNLFYSPRMPRLMSRLRKEFDMVMIDAPPMIHLADARLLGRLADGVILVIRAGQTTTESALFASQRFAEDGTRVLGTILNNWEPTTGGRYGYGSYSDYRQYVEE
jgi:succinoglycan biosynthesis transport protein ExoP